MFDKQKLLLPQSTALDRGFCREPTQTIDWMSQWFRIGTRALMAGFETRA